MRHEREKLKPNVEIIDLTSGWHLASGQPVTFPMRPVCLMLPKAVPSRKPRDPDALLTAAEAADLLNVTTEQLLAHADDGTLRFINIGRGTKRPRYRFDPTDITAFKAARTQENRPCPSIAKQAPTSFPSTSSSRVIGFLAARAARQSAKPKRSKP
jgi:excisionase family DNA binding protein